jgi:hypothetical protein
MKSQLINPGAGADEALAKKTRERERARAPVPCQAAVTLFYCLARKVAEASPLPRGRHRPTMRACTRVGEQDPEYLIEQVRQFSPGIRRIS